MGQSVNWQYRTSSYKPSNFTSLLTEHTSTLSHRGTLAPLLNRTPPRFYPHQPRSAPSTCTAVKIFVNVHVLNLSFLLMGATTLTQLSEQGLSVPDASTLISVTNTPAMSNPAEIWLVTVEMSYIPELMLQSSFTYPSMPKESTSNIWCITCGYRNLTTVTRCTHMSNWATYAPQTFLHKHRCEFPRVPNRLYRMTLTPNLKWNLGPIPLHRVLKPKPLWIHATNIH